ncbi:MAG TPA: hypothetical protein VMO78_07950 [Rhizomicrobium sp.]|nr:hypothetical protein [Rhizomicrobium sp.]
MESRPQNNKNSRLSPAGWIAILVLLGLLGLSLWYAIQVWTSMAGVHMSGWGWLFLVLGVVVTIALGAGLMGLVFYSSRHDYDR